MAFNKDTFEAAFAAALETLAGAEKVTKESLRTLSRTVLEAHHECQNPGYINELLAVLTPMNFAACREFFKHFSGYWFDEKTGTFGKKNSKLYEQALADTVEFMEDPHNNVWTWSAQHVKVEAKPFELSKVTKFIDSAVKKADKNGFSKAEVLMAVIGAGFEVGELIAALETMGAHVEVEGVLTTTTANIKPTIPAQGE